MLLEPESDTAAPVFAVQQSSCFPINGNVKFDFVYMPNGRDTETPVAVYGSIEAQTNTTGTAWNFVSQVQYTLPYTFLGPPALGPAHPTGNPSKRESIPAHVPSLMRRVERQCNDDSEPQCKFRQPGVSTADDLGRGPDGLLP